MHDVQRIQNWECSRKHRWNDGKVLSYIVGDRKGSQGAARHQQLFADFDDLDELGGIGIQVHHIPGFLCGLRSGIHGDAHVCLG